MPRARQSAPAAARPPGAADASPPPDVAAGAVDLVVRQRGDLEAVLARHGVPPAEAAALVGEALLAVAAEGCTGAARRVTAPEGRLVRALEIACARRGGKARRQGALGSLLAPAAGDSQPAAEPSSHPAAVPVSAAGGLGRAFAVRIAATLPDDLPRQPGSAVCAKPQAVEAQPRADAGARPDADPDAHAHAHADAGAHAAADDRFAAVVDSVARRCRDLGRRVAEERREAPARAAAAVARPDQADPAPLATRGVAEHLLAAAAAAWVEDAHHARDLATLAVRVARRLDAAVYGAASLADLEARAVATLANAERVIGNLAAAEAGFAEAGALLAAGSRDPLSRAYLLRLQSTLRRTQGRADEALRLLDQAAAIYRWLGETHLEGRTLLQRAKLFEEDDPRQAAALARQGLAAIDLAREPRLELVAVHNLAMVHHRAGELDAAAALLPRVAAAAARVGGRLDRLRLRWLAAQIATDRGEEAAAAELAAVRDAFLAEEMPLDALLAALDLAAHHLARGRTAEARRLAEELVPLAASRPLDRRTLAALLLFQQAARADRATVELVRATAARVRRERHVRHDVVRPS